MEYAPPLDGLRAIAVMAVLIFHTFPRAMRGGFTGVDVFFVLSGYLITSVISHDLRASRFSLREFYLRRVQRLVPNVLATVAGTLAIAALLLPMSFSIKAARHGFWVLFNASNFYIWRNVGGYWGDASASVPLLHTWSLAVEEQFYILFPVSLLLVSRRAALRVWVGAAAAASLALCILATPRHADASFYLLPTRAWEILVGAMLALQRTPPVAGGAIRRIGSSWLTAVAGPVGLVVMLAGFFAIRENAAFPGSIALIPCGGALAVLVSVADARSAVARLLSKPAMVLVGRWSYSLYLWHWPPIVLARVHADLTGGSRTTASLVGAVAGVVLAILAYYVVEQPLRRRGPGRRRRLVTVAVGFCVCVVATAALRHRRAEADFLHLFDPPVFRGLAYDAGGTGADDTSSFGARYADVSFPPATPRPRGSWRHGGIIHDWGGGPPRVVVLGSSHALMYGALIDDLCRRLHASVAFLSVDGTSVFFPAVTTDDGAFPSPEALREFDAARRRFLSEWRPDLIIAVDRWDTYAASPATFEHQVGALVEELTRYGRHVVLVDQVPVLRLGETINLREYVSWYRRRTGTMPVIASDGNEAVRRSATAMLEAAVARAPTASLLHAARPFRAPDGAVRWSSARTFYYADDDHLTDAGAERLRQDFSDAIGAALAR